MAKRRRPGLASSSRTPASLKVASPNWKTPLFIFLALSLAALPFAYGKYLEFGTNGFQEMNQVQLVSASVRRISILVSLPPDKSSDFITLILVLREVSREVIQYCMSFSDEIVVLLAGVPVDFLTGINRRP